MMTSSLRSVTSVRALSQRWLARRSPPPYSRNEDGVSSRRMRDATRSTCGNY
jgi:hypothetical protein